MSPIKPTETERLIYSVTQLTREIKVILEGSFPGVWVEGEISNYNLHSSGHIYFDLKDAESVLHCAFFRNVNQNIKFELKDGLKAICFGRVSVYDRRGQYQLYIDKIEPKGIGELQLAFEQLKQRLEKQGLFDSAHKVPIPILPSRIGIATSPTGAVIRDMLHILRRRFKDLEILIYPVKVQGDTAAQEIAMAVEDFNRLRNVDVLILARGGGSLEDLWAFNEEILARAIYNSEIPIISAVGHEVDYTISDFVADLRAPTPSAAAELVVAKKEEFIERIEGFLIRLKSSLDNAVSILENRLRDLLESPAFKYPFEKIELYEQRLDDLTKSMDRNISHTIDIKSEKFNTVIGKLEVLSPLSVLTRGYSITLHLPKGDVLKDTKGLKRGDKIETRLLKGRVISEVKEVKKEDVK
ncbi:MAG: exodeoxyribonuclease VII large subunit [Omnitrophica WOR_2 bacterium SM23_29]|nr:MAG: exodeoxyribonuclease VII large subunit [Omnitrophica WOR_2 bacterium SM23_29]